MKAKIIKKEKEFLDIGDIIVNNDKDILHIIDTGKTILHKHRYIVIKYHIYSWGFTNWSWIKKRIYLEDLPDKVKLLRIEK